MKRRRATTTIWWHRYCRHASVMFRCCRVQTCRPVACWPATTWSRGFPRPWWTVPVWTGAEARDPARVYCGRRRSGRSRGPAACARGVRRRRASAGGGGGRRGRVAAVSPCSRETGRTAPAGCDRTPGSGSPARRLTRDDLPIRPRTTTAQNHNTLHAHPFNGPYSGTTRVSQYQKGKTNVDFTEARDSEWQWHQLGHMQVCTSLQTTTPAPHHSVFYRPDALPAVQSTASKHWRQLNWNKQNRKNCRIH